VIALAPPTPAESSNQREVPVSGGIWAREEALEEGMEEEEPPLGHGSLGEREAREEEEEILNALAGSRYRSRRLLQLGESRGGDLRDDEGETKAIDKHEDSLGSKHSSRRRKKHHHKDATPRDTNRENALFRATNPSPRTASMSASYAGSVSMCRPGIAREFSTAVAPRSQVHHPNARLTD